MTLILSTGGILAVMLTLIVWALVRADRQAKRDPYRDLGVVRSHTVIRRDNGQEF